MSNIIPNELIGQGWQFPPTFDKTTQEAQMVSGVDEIENSLHVIMHTQLGERIMRNEFGTNLHELIFEPLTENMKTYMAASLRTALAENEPRIAVTEIVLEQPDPMIGRVDIRISYTIHTTQQRRSYVLPYYLPDNNTRL